MTFIEAVVRDVRGVWSTTLLWTVLPLIPFIVAEQLRPVGARPRWSDYATNILINLSTVVLTVPSGITAARCGGWLRAHLPWSPLAFSFATLRDLPHGGRALAFMAMVLAPLFLHDLWFYWAHRLEHAIPLLWEFHKVHHSDRNMNCSTFARDQFLQVVWRAFFPLFTLALVLDLTPTEAGQCAFYSSLFVVLWTMFYHSSIRVRLPWLDRMLVTPQVHRIHHAAEGDGSSSNFADFFPLFDVLFGTFRRPGRDEFPATGLPDAPAHRSMFTAQVGPLLGMAKKLGFRRLPRGDHRAPAPLGSLPANGR